MEHDSEDFDNMKGYGAVNNLNSTTIDRVDDSFSKDSKIVPTDNLKYIGIILSVVLFTVLMSYNSFGQDAIDIFTTKHTVVEVVDFSFYRSGYDSLPFFNQSETTYSMLDDYVAIFEPNAKMNIDLIGSESKLSIGNSYVYRICPVATAGDCIEEKYTSADANPIVISCSAYDVYNITVTEYSGRQTVGEGFGLALCLYVRREIRSLSAADLSATMDAMYELWTYSESDGQALYGENYHPASYFSNAHSFNAAQQDSDHIHEGVGFMTQHIKMTNMFELAMQAVDSSIALPYWDFTIEMAEGTDWVDSIIFSPETFGTITLPADNYWGWTYTNDEIESSAIADGRWAGLQADVNTLYEGLGNSFGYMRGPWNMNPSPYVSRFAVNSSTMPGCSDYFDMLSLTSLKDFLSTSPYAPHASTHGAIGGVFGCDMLDPFRASGMIQDSSSQKRICKKWGFYMKELYRADLITGQDDCTADSLDFKGISCGFTCATGAFDQVTAALMNQVLGEMDPDTTDEQWESLAEFVCYGNGYRIFVGDHLEAASPADPSFWPIHPTIERLMQVRLIAGGFPDVWPVDADDVCDKAECYEATFDNKGYYPECCYGHYADDQLLDFINGDITEHVGPTNQEILDGMDPTTAGYNMPYIYDSFSWPHCEEDFAGTISSMIAAAAAAR